MKDPYVKIKLSELTKLQNEVKYLRERLNDYEPPIEFRTLLGKDSDLPKKNEYPLFKPGPKGLLEDMPITFKKEFAKENGINMNCITTWMARGYLEYNKENDTYTKTDRYLERLKLAKMKHADFEPKIK